MKAFSHLLTALLVVISVPLAAQPALEVHSPSDGSSIPDGIAGQEYDPVWCTAHDAGPGFPPPVKCFWSLEGDVPPGLIVTNVSVIPGEKIQGTLAENATPREYRFTLVALEKDVLNPRRATAELSMTVLRKDTLIIIAPPPTTTRLPDGVAGARYPASAHAEVKCQAATADKPDTLSKCDWELRGDYPSGIEIEIDDDDLTKVFLRGQLKADANNGLLQKTYSFTLVATEVAVDDPQQVERPFTIVVWHAVTIEASNPGRSLRVGEQYKSGAIVASGGPLLTSRDKYRWNVLGLPEGLSYERSGDDYEIIHITGSVEAQFARELPYSITVKATNEVTVQLVFEIEVVPEPLQVVTSEFDDAIFGTPYRAKLDAVGGYSPYIWSAEGLPDGLELVEDDRRGEWFIEGELVDASAASNEPWEITLRVDDSADTPQSVTQVVPLLVRAQRVRLLTSSLPSAVQDQTYSLTLEAAFGLPPLLWQVEGLPTGLSLTSSDDLSHWEIQGTPESEGKHIVSITVSDSTLPAATADATRLSFTVDKRHQESLTVSNTWLPVAKAGEQYQQVVLEAEGGTPPYAWSAIGLPEGIRVELRGVDGASVLMGALEMNYDSSYFVNLVVSDSSEVPLRANAILKLIAQGTSPSTDDSNTSSQNFDLLKAQLAGTAAGACSLGKGSDAGGWMALMVFLLLVVAGRISVKRCHCA